MRDSRILGHADSMLESYREMMMDLMCIVSYILYIWHSFSPDFIFDFFYLCD